MDPRKTEATSLLRARALREESPTGGVLGHREEPRKPVQQQHFGPFAASLAASRFRTPVRGEGRGEITLRKVEKKLRTK